MDINWSVVSSVAAAASAIASCFGVYYSKKSYEGNLEKRSKIEILNLIRNLVPELLAAIRFTSYLYDKASANDHDKKLDKEK